MKRGDIYLLSLDPTTWHQQRGSRLVVVVSPSEFNEVTKLPVILPITNGSELARRLGFSVPVIGIKTTCIMNCDQLRVIDLSARKASRVGTMLEAIMDEVLARVVTLFD